VGVFYVDRKDIRKGGEKRRQERKIGMGKKSKVEIGKVRRKGSWAWKRGSESRMGNLEWKTGREGRREGERKSGNVR
jgi:hypothetical protein